MNEDVAYARNTESGCKLGFCEQLHTINTWELWSFGDKKQQIFYWKMKAEEKSGTNNKFEKYLNMLGGKLIWD